MPCIIFLAAIGFFWGEVVQTITNKDKIKRERQDAVKRSRAVLGGQFSEQLAPFFPEYHPYVDLTGAVLKVVPPNTDTFQINFEAFEEMLTENVQ